MGTPFGFRVLRWAAPWLIPKGLDARIGKNSVVHPRRLQPSGRNTLEIGADSIVLARLIFERQDAAVRIGSRTFVGLGTLAAATRIDIGSDVLMSWGVTIVDHQSHALSFDQRRDDVTNWLSGRKDWSHVFIAPVVVEDCAWIGFDAALMPGVRVGRGAVVAARAVVTRDVEPWTVVAGVPARVIKRLDPSDSPVLGKPSLETQS